MIPRKSKISRISFPSHVERKRIWSGSSLRIYCYLSGDTPARFAVVVSKKQFSTHVAKNAFKRAVFSEVTLCQYVFNRMPFGKYVFYPTKSVESISRRDIHITIATFLNEYGSPRTAN